MQHCCTSIRTYFLFSRHICYRTESSPSTSFTFRTTNSEKSDSDHGSNDKSDGDTDDDIERNNETNLSVNAELRIARLKSTQGVLRESSKQVRYREIMKKVALGFADENFIRPLTFENVLKLPTCYVKKL